MCTLGAGKAAKEEGDGVRPHCSAHLRLNVFYSAKYAEACEGRAVLRRGSWEGRRISPKDITLLWTLLGTPWVVAAALQSLLSELPVSQGGLSLYSGSI